MKLPINTLQPDYRGFINVSGQTVHAQEILRAMADGSLTTTDLMHMNGQLPVLARDRITDTEAPGNADAQRQGPLVVPFVRHAMGFNRHAFCADSSLLVAMDVPGASSPSAPLKTGTVVELFDFNSTAYLPVIRKATVAGSVYAIVRGVVEDAAMRTAAGLPSFAYANVYALQLFGITRALVTGGEDAAALAALYVGADAAGTLHQSGSSLLGYNLGAPVALDGISDYTSNLVFIPPAGGSGTTYPTCWEPLSINQDDSTIMVGGGMLIDSMTTLVVGENNEVTVAGGTSGSPDYVTLRYTYGSGISILAQTLHTIPHPTKSTFEVPLMEVYKHQGLVYIKRRLCQQVIILPGIAARF